MSMSSHVYGIIPADETYMKMKKVYETCKEADIDVPDEVIDFFDGQKPEEDGMTIDISEFATESKGDMCEGLCVDIESLLKKIPSIKKLSFMNCY